VAAFGHKQTFISLYRSIVSSRREVKAVTKQKTKEWLDIVAGIAIVAGLVLVAYEVRQANIVAKATTVVSIYEGWEVFSMAEIETGISALYIRSLEDPESLTDAEVRDIGSYLNAVMSLYSKSGLLYEYGLPTNPGYYTIGPGFFKGQIARTWFDANESWIRAATPALADEITNYIDSTPLSSTNEMNENP
jgi:hypothetical protein